MLSDLRTLATIRDVPFLEQNKIDSQDIRLCGLYRVTKGSRISRSLSNTAGGAFSFVMSASRKLPCIDLHLILNIAWISYIQHLLRLTVGCC